MKFTPATTSVLALYACTLAGQQQAIDAARSLIDFSEYSAGDYVLGLGGGTRVTVSPLPGTNGTGGCFTGGKNGNAPMIFNSSNPTGDDDDLGSPHQDFGGPGKGKGGRTGAAGENSVALGNLLIISEDCNSENPDDSATGGVFTFSFTRGSKPIKSLGLMDFEQGAEITAKKSDGSVYESGFIKGVGNNGFKEIELNIERVEELTVTCMKSCAIAYLEFKSIYELGAYSDMRVSTWDGDVYKFPGECDLVLIDSPDFMSGLGMRIHLRTEIFPKSKRAFIKNAVLAIDDESLEVAAGGMMTWSNGVENMGIPTVIAGYKIKYEAEEVSSGMAYVYKVKLGGADTVTLKVFEDRVDVRIKTMQNRAALYEGSLGLVGAFETGEWLGRDGVTEYDDLVEFASQWRVMGSDPELFAEEGSTGECTLP